MSVASFFNKDNNMPPLSPTQEGATHQGCIKMLNNNDTSSNNYNNANSREGEVGVVYILLPMLPGQVSLAVVPSRCSSRFNPSYPPFLFHTSLKLHCHPVTSPYTLSTHPLTSPSHLTLSHHPLTPPYTPPYLTPSPTGQPTHASSLSQVASQLTHTPTSPNGSGGGSIGSGGGGGGESIGASSPSLASLLRETDLPPCDPDQSCYLEMVLHYAFVTLFSLPCPAVPLLSLLR